MEKREREREEVRVRRTGRDEKWRMRGEKWERVTERRNVL